MAIKTDTNTLPRLCELTQADGIPLLDPDGKFGLRVACGVRYFDSDILFPEEHKYVPGKFGRECSCQGRGWIPSQDPWAYVRAAWPHLDHYKWQLAIKVAFVDALEAGEDPGEAALAVVVEALSGKETT